MSSSKEETKIAPISITTLTQLLKASGSPSKISGPAATIFNKLSAQDLSRAAVVSKDFNE